MSASQTPAEVGRAAAPASAGPTCPAGGKGQPGQDTRPPIPLSLADRPVVGGLVAPWVNVHFADGGIDFRVTHGTRWRQAWSQGICQTCGKMFPRNVTVAFYGGPGQVEGYFTEPPLHLACAHYAERACPMVAGRMDAYATTLAVSYSKRGAQCPDPGCDCGGWVSEPGGVDHFGEPAHDWWQVLARGWKLAVDPDGTLLGGVPTNVRRKRLVSTVGGAA